MRPQVAKAFRAFCKLLEDIASARADFFMRSARIFAEEAKAGETKEKRSREDAAVKSLRRELDDL